MRFSASLRVTLLTLLGVNTAIALWFAIDMSVDAVRQREAAQLAKQSNAISDLLIEATAARARERGMTAVALNRPEPISKLSRDGIDVARAAGDSALAEALVKLRAMPAQPDWTLARDEAEAAHESLLRAREEADGLMSLPTGGRPRERVDAWFHEVTGAIDRANAVRLALDFGALSAQPVLNGFVPLKNELWAISEFAGRQRAIIGAQIARDEPLMLRTIQDLDLLEGAIIRANGQIDNLLRNRLVASNVSADIATMRLIFAAEFQRARDAAIQAGRAGQAYPMNATQWFDAATLGIEAVLNMTAVASQTARAQADAAVRRADEGVIAASVIFALVLGAALVAFLVLEWRVIRPLESLTTIMKRLAKRDWGVQVPVLARGDEIGAMARAVQVFKTSGIERDLLETEALESHRREKLRENERRELAEGAARAAHERVLALEEKMRMEAEFARVERLANLGGLVAGVAHELNTPIGNAVTVASTLSERADGFARELAAGQVRKSSLERLIGELRDGTAILMRGLQRASDLIQHFKRVAVDQTSEQRRVFRIEELVSDIAATMAPQLSRAGVTLRADIDAKWPLDSYPGPLGQVLLNLVGNAQIHGIGEGNTGTITVAARQSGVDAIEISVRDDGKGVPAGLRDRIFEPFFTTRLGQGGSGLGLSIVHNIVTKVLGGTIRVDSEVGSGTTMTMRIPLRAPTGTHGQLEGTYDVGHAKRAG
jgi:signal transduction histidine kinase